MTEKAAREAQRALSRGKRAADKELSEKPEYVSTGSTLLNLACTGRWSGGFRKGTFNFLVGDSSSGKTFLSLTCMAEAALNSAFDDYQLIYDPSENGAFMDFRRFFGPKMADRVVPPNGTQDNPEASTTVEEFYYNLDTALNRGPLIWVLDSMDGLTTDDDDELFKKRKAAKADGKQAGGSYGTAKPKLNSAYMRTVIPKLQKTGSILIVISQTRDNIGFGAQFNPKTRSGGHALKFYAHLELWSSRKETLKKSAKIQGGVAKDRQVGIISKVKVKKNRHTGREREIEVPIFHSLGIDDIGSCVSYLIDEGHWKKKKGVGVVSPEFNYSGSEENLCRHIDGLPVKMGKLKLRKLTGSVWKAVEEACKVERRNPYQEADGE